MSSSSLGHCVLCLTYTLLFLPAEVEFNVSEAFVPLTTPNSNHSSHTGNDPVDSGTLERKRPASMAVMEGDLVKKERCVQSYDLHGGGSWHGERQRPMVPGPASVDLSLGSDSVSTQACQSPDSFRNSALVRCKH